MYRDSKAVSFKEEFDYSPTSTSTEKSNFFLRNDRDYKDVDLSSSLGKKSVASSDMSCRWQR